MFYIKISHPKVVFNLGGLLARVIIDTSLFDFVELKLIMII